MPRYWCELWVVTKPAENRTRLAVSSISKVCRPIFQTVSWVQRNEVIISNLKVHWRRSISRLSVHDNTAAKIFVRLSVQGLFFCVLERFTFFFGTISFSQSALLSF